MAPTTQIQARPSLWKSAHRLAARQATSSHPKTIDWRLSASDEDLILESWSQGVVVGALMIMACITVANMRRGVLLHKLILAELLLAMSHGTFCFMDYPGYGWYLSSTAMLLYISWIIHNIVAWLKVKPFFSQPGGSFKPRLSTWTKRIYLGTLALSVPVIIFQISNNFRFFNNRGGYYHDARAWEPLMRDPWWIFTCVALFHVIRKCYGTGTIELVRRSPRFGILLCAIILSIAFTICDIAASIPSTSMIGSTEGINPWWKLSLVFKCLTDTIMLDDFKTELKRLGIKRIAKEEQRRNTLTLVDEHDALDMPYSDNETESSASSRERNPSRWYGRNSLARAGTACDISPTTSLQHAHPNGRASNVDTKALNNPNANMDELEFSTALSLDPSRLSGVDSVKDPKQRSDEDEIECHDQTQKNRQPLERNSVTGHTKRLAQLPSLKQWRFEAIKPGKNTKSRQSASDRTIPPDETTAEDEEMIARIEAATKQRPQNNNNKQPVNRWSWRDKNPASDHDQDDQANQLAACGTSSEDSSATVHRVHRFKQSIGAQ